MLLLRQSLIKFLLLGLLFSSSSCGKKPLVEVLTEIPVEAEVKVATSEMKQEGTGNISVTIKDGMISILSLATFLSFIAFLVKSAQKKKGELLLSTVVKGIELADNDEIKKVIKLLSEKDNVEKALDTFVQRTT